MKKKKLSGLKLNKVKIADLNDLNGISGGTQGPESHVICEEGDTGGGGGTGGASNPGCQSIFNCQPTQQCGPTQQTCGITGTATGTTGGTVNC